MNHPMIPGASALEGRDDLAQVVADDTEPGGGEAGENTEHREHYSPDVLGVLLDDPPEGVLGVIGHGVSLVQNDQLVAPKGTGSHGSHRYKVSGYITAFGNFSTFIYGLPLLVEDGFSGGEVENLSPDDPDATVVTGVQLQHLKVVECTTAYITTRGVRGLFSPWR